jgi:hypothetical protein
MLSKKTYIALGLVVVQSVALIFLLRSPKRTERASVLPTISTADVTKVVLSKGTDVVEMTRKEAPATATPDGGPPPEADWMLQKPVQYAADKSAVKQLLDRLAKMSISPDPISRKKEWHDEKFGVGEKTGWKLELFGRDNNPITSVFLGKTQEGRTFLRKPGDDAVYQATGIAAYAFDKKPNDWRDKIIFDADDKQISKIEIKGAETVVLARDSKDEKKWVLEQPTGIKLDKGKAESVGRTLAKLRAKEFAEAEKPETTGLASPEAVVVAELKDQSKLTLLIGKKKGQNDQYVKRADKDTVFVIGSWQVDQIYRKPADLKEKEPVIAKPAGEDVQRIEVKGATKVTVQRTGEGWRMTSPVVQEADKNAVLALFAEVQKLNVPEGTFGGKEKHAEYQLDAKGVRVELFGAGGKRLTGFIIGKEDKGQTYVRKVSDPKVYKAYGLARAGFEKSVEAWRSKQILSFAEADALAIELEREGSSLRLARSENAWKIEKPKSSAADEKKVKDLLAALANLFAADFASGAKPEETGLAKPLLKISVEIRGRGARTVLVGNKNAKGDYFAKRADRPEVYLLASSQLPKVDKKFDDLTPQNGQKK